MDAKSTFPSLAAAIRAWRMAADLTQVELSEKLEVAQNTLSAWEQGQRPEPAAFQRLVKALGVNRNEAAWLYVYGDSERPAC